MNAADLASQSRLRLGKIPPGVLTIYRKTAHSMEQTIDLSELRVGIFTGDTQESLLTLDLLLREHGYLLVVSDGFRDPDEQQRARDRYLAWVRAGRPRPSNPAWRASMKAAFVAVPGESWHVAGRAVDIDVNLVRGIVPGMKAWQAPEPVEGEDLAGFWELLRKTGWNPIVERPDSRLSEAWHIEYRGPWATMAEALGSAMACRAAQIDVGTYRPTEEQRRKGFDPTTADLQAQLSRSGYRPGAIDGQIGPKTRAAAKAAGIDLTVSWVGAVVAARALPDAPWGSLQPEGAP